LGSSAAAGKDTSTFGRLPFAGTRPRPRCQGAPQGRDGASSPMIKYKRGGRWHLLNIFLMRGSLFPAAFAMAAPSAAISLLLKRYDIFPESSILLNSTIWGGFSSLVGFLVVFRTSEAYSRFWDGCTATHLMRAEWIDAAISIMAFCRHSTAPEEEITRFKHLTVRLFSLLHAMALGEIEECEDFEDVMAFDLELIDPCGLDRESWRILKTCHNKVILVFTWLQTVIVENIKTGILEIPAPILSRVFQELANGMVALHEAQKISNIPFPFPYAQTCDALLFIHWLITPLVTAQWTSNMWSAAIFGFVQVFILWSLNNIAVEIEHPFGNDANDLDASQMQLDMNMNLLLVLHPAATRAPQLSPEAEIRGLVSMGRRASQALTKMQKTYNDVILSGHAEEGSFWSGSMEFDENGNGLATPAESRDSCASVFDGNQPPLVHMDPICSQQLLQAQVGDNDPTPVLGSPRSPRQRGGRPGPCLDDNRGDHRPRAHLGGGAEGQRTEGSPVSRWRLLPPTWEEGRLITGPCPDTGGTAPGSPAPDSGGNVDMLATRPCWPGGEGDRGGPSPVDKAKA